MWKKRILPLLCALALLAGALAGPGAGSADEAGALSDRHRTPAQLETGGRLPQATPELASDAGLPFI